MFNYPIHAGIHENQDTRGGGGGRFDHTSKSHV